MVKTVILTLSLFILTSCVKEGDKIEQGAFGLTTETITESNGCKYKIINHYNGGVDIINLTKDSLEVEYYKSQINMNNTYFNN